MSAMEKDWLPCCKPQLPGAESIFQYLKEIDASRWYSNYGPLAIRFHEALAQHWGIDSRQVVTVANGTLGLALALMAQQASRGGLCLMPSWTFVATPHAACLAGLEPHFVDVDQASWALTPELAKEALARVERPVSAVMPVCPFGAPIDAAVWEAFEKETSIPVVIDAAAAFDGLQAGRVPAVVSLHATKALGVGEGGLVVSQNIDLIEEIQKRSNFGFFGNRQVAVLAMNAKLSEYHAAVGLAALDQWPQQRAFLEKSAGLYRQGLKDCSAAKFLDGFGPEWVSATCSIAIDGVAQRIVAGLADKKIKARRWWGAGCHQEEAFRGYGREALPVTDQLAEAVLSLPFFPGITATEIESVVNTVSQLINHPG
jgi:dTDP-4-amino-4,6-dideoxygalactose transaminase